MKRILLPLFCCVLCFHSEATTWNVTVQDYQFSPASLNVAIGDVIHWQWKNGTHTTSSISIPSGAQTWDEAITGTNTSYDYVATVPGAYSYQCNIHASIMTGSFVVTAALPVTLSSFDISAVHAKPVLKWATETEINSDYFSIRKSTNGSDFKEIGKVAAAGNSAIEKNYSFTDENISSSTKYIYYALAIIDKDGRTALSPIKLYKNKFATAKIITLISPNPVSSMGHLKLQFNADKAGLMKVKMTDMQGRLVFQTELTAQRGINNGHLQLMSIPAGSYTLFFNLEAEEINESCRIIKN